MRFITTLSGLIVTTVVLTACGQNNGIDANNAGNNSPATVLSLPEPLDNLIQSRMVDRSVLFAEVIFEYEDVVETVTVSRQDNTDVWATNFRLPSGRDYTLDVTWYDTADGSRLDLINFNRSFNAMFASSAMNFDFSDYDFDGYDEDDDGITNLAERQAGTSPLVANVTFGCPVLPQAQSNVNDEPILFYENQVRFTDGFDTGLPLYSTQNRNLGDAGDGLFVESVGSVRLLATGSVGTETGDSAAIDINPVLSSDPDSMFVRLRMLPDTTEVRSVDGSSPRFRLDGEFFNSIADGGVDDPDADSRTGDVELSIQMRSYQDGENASEFLHCARVRESDGSKRFFIDITEDGDQDGCAKIEALPSDVEVGREYLIGLGIDRQAQTIFFQIDGQRVEVPSTLPMFRAARPYLRAGVAANGEGHVSSARISEITVNGVTDDQLTDLDPAVITRYRNIDRHDGDPNRLVSSEDGILKLEGTANDDVAVRTDLFIDGNTNYVAADLRLSSETLVTGENRSAAVRITGAQYNDLANGGVNDNEGDHWASLGLQVESTGERFASACLFRSQTADYESVCSVMETPEDICPQFSTPIEFDTYYRTSISFDRINKRLIYQLNDEQIVHDVTTNVFLPAGGSKATNTRISGRGRVVGLVDNLSTIPTGDASAVRKR